MSASTPEGGLVDLLCGHLAALTLTPALPVAYPDQPFTPPAGAYLHADYLPNTNVRLFHSSTDETQHQGLFQVTVVGVAGQGIIKPLDIAGQVAAHFSADAVLRGGLCSLKITSKPSVGQPLQDAGRTRVPVTIRWRAFI